MRPERTDMVRVSDFIALHPIDGSLPTQRTDVYMGYDSHSLYIVWVCFDKEPEKIRAHLGRRENIFDDDYVEMTLDTFHDQRHGLVFSANALGIQADERPFLDKPSRNFGGGGVRPPIVLVGTRDRTLQDYPPNRRSFSGMKPHAAKGNCLKYHIALPRQFARRVPHLIPGPVCPASALAV